MPPSAMFQIKVTLRDSRPPIWRRVLVSGNATLLRLHEILQRVMGWRGGHLHLFSMGDEEIGGAEPEGDEQEQAERRLRVRHVLFEPRDRLFYLYDFGDAWEHDVLLEKIWPPGSGMRLPAVIGGERACPPEDVGGVDGYEEFLEAIRDPQHPEHAAMLAWVGGAFDPEAFDVQAADRMFERGAARRAATKGAAAKPAAAKRAATKGAATKPAATKPAAAKRAAVKGAEAKRAAATGAAATGAATKGAATKRRATKRRVTTGDVTTYEATKEEPTKKGGGED